MALVVNANAQEVSATYDPDVDGDNNIGVTDLLALLSLFQKMTWMMTAFGTRRTTVLGSTMNAGYATGRTNSSGD